MDNIWKYWLQLGSYVAKNMMLISPLSSQLDCCVYRTLGLRHTSSMVWHVTTGVHWE